MNDPTPPAEKVWGVTEQIFHGNNIEVHRIQARAGGYCSKHRHAHKWNRFYVLRGKLRIERSVKGGSDELDQFGCHLAAGQSMDVPPGIWHRFEALEDTDAIEVYWVELGEDIERQTEGGMRAVADDVAMALSALKSGDFQTWQAAKAELGLADA